MLNLFNLHSVSDEGRFLFPAENFSREKFVFHFRLSATIKAF